MTIEIKLQSHPAIFQGNTIEEAITTIVEWIKKNHSCPSEFSQEIEKVEKFSNDCFAETINKKQTQEIEEKLNDQLSEAEQDYYNGFEEEDWRDQESATYWANR